VTASLDDPSNARASKPMGKVGSTRGSARLTENRNDAYSDLQRAASRPVAAVMSISAISSPASP
jgi:hypothetical protein